MTSIRIFNGIQKLSLIQGRIWPKNFQQGRYMSRHVTRQVLKVHDPLAKVRDDGKVAYDFNAKAASVSDFNLTMGDITLGKGHKLIAVEGTRNVEDALKAGLKLEKIFLVKSIKSLSPSLDYLLDVERKQKSPSILVHRVGQKLMETWSSTTTPPGIIGIFKKPKPGELKPVVGSVKIPITLICDNIREPGNLGSILRSASCAGIEEAVLTKGCVDAWNMKVIRGSCGAHFRLPLSSDVAESQLEKMIEKRIPEGKLCFLICDSCVSDQRLPTISSTSFWELDYSPFSHIFLVIGGETEGIGDTTVAIGKKFKSLKNGSESIMSLLRVRIPLANEMDSLNAANAFGIMLFEILRQLRIK